MKNNIIKLGLGAVMASACLLFTSCENFLNRPGEDNYNTENYYTSDDACLSGVNYLYNSPWYDFQRGFIKVGEVFSGNMYWGSSPYLNFSVNGTDQDLVNMSYSLWAEIAHCSTVYNNIKASTSTAISDKVRNQCLGECLAWKAMAYFYLVRTFGEVPIVHDNSAELDKGEYNTYKKHSKADVYEYIILTLEKAIDLLPAKNIGSGRIDGYCAKALLAKVYLTRAGLSGTLNNDDLLQAAKFSKEVIDESERYLTPKYSDIFRGSHNNDPESLFAWRWAVGSHWTCQNTLQSDLAPEGFGDQGDLWGGWGGPSVDLMNAFGVIEMKRITPDSAVIVTFKEPAANTDAFADARCAATLMLPGIHYDYFWRNKGGFDVLNFFYDKEYNKAATDQFQGPCGCQNVKHLYGNDADHIAETGIAPARMAYSFDTHILRLGDIYLVNAEANLLASGGDKDYGQARLNDVRHRAGLGDAPSYDFETIWNERRLELAGEGDRWYDYVRRAYYDADACLAEIKAQFRNQLWGCDKFYKQYYNEGGDRKWNSDLSYQGEKTIEYVSYNNELEVPHNIDAKVFTIPFPTEDVALNPNLGSGVEVDDFGAEKIRETFIY